MESGESETRETAERRKLDLEIQNLEKESSRGILERHPGILVALLVSIAATAVSLAQIQIQKNASLREAEQRQYQIQRDNEDRNLEWRYRTLEFITLNADGLITDEPGRRDQMEQLILNVFPPDFAREVLEAVSKNAGDQNTQDAWKEAASSIFPNISGTWIHAGKTSRYISQSGNRNEHLRVVQGSHTYSGSFIDSNKITVGFDANCCTGKISGNERRIIWSNGSAWDR